MPTATHPRPSLSPPPPGSIHGQKFHDSNANAQRDPGEVGLNDWTIRLVDADGTEVATQETHDLDLNGDGSIDP